MKTDGQQETATAGHPRKTPGLRRLPPNNPSFAKQVVKIRGQLGLTQGELARTAGVSPRTVVQLEERGTARAEVIIRLAAATGQNPEDWLRNVGHPSNAERIRDVLNQRDREKSTPPFARVDPTMQFERMARRLHHHGNALMCSFITSQVPIDNPKLFERFKEMVDSGLHLALVCPFPIAESDILRRPRLGAYYLNAFKWARLLAKQIQDELPKRLRMRINVFSPRSDNGSVLVSPPIRMTEVRPAFIKYGTQPESTAQFELGAYIRFLDGRPDQWIEIYGGEGTPNERVQETLDAWHDYCADIVDCWTPNDESRPFDDSRLVFWKHVPLE